MTDDVLNARLAEARDRINALPAEQRGPLLALVEETRQRHLELKKSFNRIHEAVDEWRLLMKYLIFDREATRRELDQLRKRLDGSEPS
ncbi:MAG TPA: transcriptional regulator [Phycisphaerae bacterium]|nr:transcriptional regulator [Phycisphaerae bacterium]HRY69248.1 transcriptional regulator [Phycisphaerae bacterium]HSA26566.1 transcriptional regulator [Phycisphaerae bacterium]